MNIYPVVQYIYIYNLNYKTKLRDAGISLLDDGGESPPLLAESFFIPLHHEKYPHQIFIPFNK